MDTTLYAAHRTTTRKGITNIFRRFSTGQVDGIIMVRSLSSDSDNDDDEALLRLLGDINIPVILLDRSIPHSDKSVIRLDNHKGGYTAARHLLELGHKRIGCYTGSMSISSSIERLNGYKSALENMLFPFCQSLSMGVITSLADKTRRWHTSSITISAYYFGSMI